MGVRLALLWHQHQPSYLDPLAEEPRGSALLPWVRLHATRDYAGMARLAAEHDVRVTINLVPALLEQVEGFALGASDRLEEAALAGDADPELVRQAFEAHPEHQILPWPRYAELWRRWKGGHTLTGAELRDAATWQQLSWFPSEERDRVLRLLHLGREYTPAEAAEAFAEARAIAATVIPLHRQLQTVGRLELTTTPYFHPILPLLLDSDAPGEPRPLPTRFSHPDDADAQIALALQAHRRWFRALPAGMWPAEGAVSAEAVRRIAAAGLRWIATDEGILEKAGVDVRDPRNLARPYRAEGTNLAVFFRDRELSDRIGFSYAGWKDPEAAAEDFVSAVAAKYGHTDGTVAVVLDGENAWSWYADDGRPFLRALYRRLERHPVVRTATFSQALDASGPLTEIPIATGSWIDDPGSAPGVDLGTWIGKPRKNALWDRLGARRARGMPAHGAARRALLAAEGSDWFWWGHRDDSPEIEAAFTGLFDRLLAGAGDGS